MARFKKIILSSLLFGCSLAKLQAQETKPNIILIVADDLGYSDVGAYGGEIATPNLDKMAGEGLRLSRMHNNSMCVISRTSLLSGQWWPKAGRGLQKGTTVAEELKQQGYRTGVVGKWHLQGEPYQKGFDYFFGFLGGFSSYFSGGTDYRYNKTPFKAFGENYYSTDAFTDSAISFITPKKGAASNQPFFLYLAYQSPHNPLQAPREDIMKYRGRYLKGWMAIREARIKNQIKFGILDKNAALPAYPLNLPDWDSLSPEQKDLEDLRMSVYAAMVERMDNGIGKLMKALQQNGQDKNTLILFLSDNGNDPFTSTDAAMLRQGLLPGDAGSNWQIGMGWAFAGVTPWRLYKISQHSGGVMTGAIAWWPSGIKERGKVIKSSLHVVDVMPTLLNIVAADKTTYASLAGETFLPLLQGKKWQRKGPMFFQFVDNRSVKTNRWNLVEVDGNGWELYDVQNDFFEIKDLARQHPEIVKELDAKWMNWWMTDGNNKTYKPESTKTGPHYFPQGDRGSGKIYNPTPMPESLSKKYKN